MNVAATVVNDYVLVCIYDILQFFSGIYSSTGTAGQIFESFYRPKRNMPDVELTFIESAFASNPAIKDVVGKLHAFTYTQFHSFVNIMELYATFISLTS